MKKIVKWIDLRETPEGYEPIIERDKDGNIISIIYCPYMPVFED